MSEREPRLEVHLFRALAFSAEEAARVRRLAEFVVDWWPIPVNPGWPTEQIASALADAEALLTLLGEKSRGQGMDKDDGGAV